LAQIGPPAEAALDTLTATLRSTLPSVRRNSALALGNLGPAAKGAVEALLPMLEDPDAVTRVRAAVALWQIEHHAAAIPALIRISQQPGRGAYQAAVSLGQIDAPAAAVVPALVAALRHAQSDVRRAAARSLGRLARNEAGSPQRTVLPALTQALDAPDQRLRHGAAEALGWIGPPAVPELIRALSNDSPAVRRSAARSLGRLGPAAQTAETALTNAVNDPDDSVGQTAYRALLQIRSSLSRTLD